MALIVETGQGLAAANALASLEYCTAYHALRGHAAWAAAGAADQEAAVVRASSYLCRHFRWRGQRAVSGQALAWPRRGVVDAEGREVTADQVPAAVAEACAEAALRELTASLSPDLGRGGLIRRERVAEIEVEYEPGAPGGIRVAVLEELLAPLTLSPGMLWAERG
ncbi:MAG: hypothetical protein KQJ78_08725 [Deltaproteobacteria bacterium]|nr:hypothetical protein [Deltaproteobacteria bacterium]